MYRSKRIMMTCMFAIVGTLALSDAQAAVLNVNFGRSSDGNLFGGNADYTGQGAYADAGNNTWNNLMSSSSAFPSGSPFGSLVYSDNSAATGVSVSIGGSGGSENYSPNASIHELLFGFIMANSTNFSDSITISGLTAPSYDLYVYSAKENARDTQFRLAGGSAITLTGDQVTSFVADENYHVFASVTPTAGAITFEWTSLTTGGNFTQGPLNAFQLVSIPAPAALPVGLVLLGLVATRRA